MTFTAFYKKTQDYAAKAMAILYVAAQWAAKAAKGAWRDRKALAPVAARYFIVFMLGMIMALLVFRTKDAKATKDVPFTTREELIAAAAAAEAAPVVEETEPVDVVAQQAAIEKAARHREAQYMARVLYGTARNNSAEAQRAVCWCIINRVESSLFPNSIEEVCAQPVQWMGYSGDNPVTQDLYDIASEVLEAWHSGGIRMFGQDYLYLSWSEHELVLRTSFNETKNTRYWHVNG